MIELGYSLEDEAVFEEFNFINTMEDIENTYPSVKKMNVFSFGAIPFDQTEEEIEKERKRAVRQTRDTYEITEMDGMFNQEPVIYRYIPYIPSQGNKEQVKVIEMVYSETSAFSLFTEHKFMFVVKLLLIMGISLMLPYVLIKIYSRSYRSLFYNDTTKRKNRVAFDHDLKEKLSKEEAFSLLLFQVKDVDINDIQHLLQFFEEKLSEFKMNETIYDLGAGEFGCIVTDNENTDLDLMTKLFIEKMDEVKESNVSASIHIGTASANQNDTVKILYKKADTALDQAKQINNSNVQYDENHPQISNHG